MEILCIKRVTVIFTLFFLLVSCHYKLPEQKPLLLLDGTKPWNEVLVTEINTITEEIRSVIIKQEEIKQYWLDIQGNDVRQNAEKIILKLVQLELIVSAKNRQAINRAIDLLRNDSHYRIRSLAALLLSQVKENRVVFSALIESLRNDKSNIVRINLLHALKISPHCPRLTLDKQKNMWLNRLVSIAKDEGTHLLDDGTKLIMHGTDFLYVSFIHSNALRQYYSEQIDKNNGKEVENALIDRFLHDEDEKVRTVAQGLLDL